MIKDIIQLSNQRAAVESLMLFLSLSVANMYKVSTSVNTYGSCNQSIGALPFVEADRPVGKMD